MTTLLLALTAFFAAFITLFSGFGLGTILTLTLALFFPLPLAIAMAAFIHLINNLFKLLILRKHIDWKVTFRFGLPALIAAIFGVFLLKGLSLFSPLYSTTLYGVTFTITPTKLTIGFLILLFAILEQFHPITFKANKRELILGGILSGFFGGLSGYQGAFRTAFLIQAGLPKERFVATNSSIASLVDITRLLFYGIAFSTLFSEAKPLLLSISVLSALLGTFFATLLLRKITMTWIHFLVTALLYLLAVSLIIGII